MHVYKQVKIKYLISLFYKNDNESAALVTTEYWTFSTTCKYLYTIFKQNNLKNALN